jgi:nitroimidazol reductase NimA-like FMN-containing flavoprotein (pyridoxamine 5'-phosphate oxidase superfamily)
MPRQPVAMTADEAAAFLARKRIAIVGALAPDGSPDGEPAEFSYRDGEARFVVVRDGAMHRNLAADARVVCSVEEFPSYAGIKGVALHGTAVLVGVEGERATFRVETARVESFDFAKMRREP